MSARWERLAAPVEGTVACGPNRHRLRWQAGTLRALDHAGDGAIAARLGEDEPECLALCRRWARYRHDPRVLVLGPRHPGDAVGLGPELLERLRQDPAGDDDRAALLSLLALEPALQRRLQQQAAAGLAAPAGGPVPPVLEAATVGRLRPVLDRWAGRRDWEVTVGEAGTDPARPAAVRVGPEWLAEVWGNYLAVVAGHLVLAVLDADRGRTRVLAVAAPGKPPRPLRVRGPAPWRAVLDPADGS